MKAPYISRRNFLKKSGTGATAVALSPLFATAALGKTAAYPSANQWPGRIIEVIDPDLVAGTALSISTEREERVLAMFDRGVMELTGEASVQAALQLLFPGSNPKVCIKPNTQNPGIPTRKEVVKALVKRLIDYVTTGDKIFIFSGYGDYIHERGFSSSYFPNVVVRTNDQKSTHSPDAPMEVDGSLLRYSDTLFECDYFVNAPVLKSHSDRNHGYFTMAFKNHMNTFSPNDVYCTEATKCVRASNTPPIRDKCRLVLMSALHGTYDGDQFNAAYVFEPKAIFLSTDPATNDFVGRIRMNEERALHSLDPKAATTTTPPEYGESLELGIASVAGLVTIDMSASSIFMNADDMDAGGLISASPNPFRSATRITLHRSIADDPSLRVSVFDVKGKVVKHLAGNGAVKASGIFRWDGIDMKGMALPSGLYVLRAKVRGGHYIKKLILGR